MMTDLSPLFHPAIGTALRQYADADSLAGELNALIRDLCVVAEADLSLLPAAALCMAERISKISVKVRRLEHTLDEITQDAMEDAQTRHVLPPGVVSLDQVRAARMVRVAPL